MIRRWLGDRSGATAIEYGLLAAIAGITCAGAISKMGTSSDGLWGRVRDVITSHLG